MRNGTVPYRASLMGVCSSESHTLSDCLSAVSNGGGYFQGLISKFMTQPSTAADDIRDCRRMTPKKGVVRLPFVYVNTIINNNKKQTEMKKQHFKPEFTVIRQNEANAKFFVASGEFNNGNPASSSQGVQNVAASYDAGTGGSNDISM